MSKKYKSILVDPETHEIFAKLAEEDDRSLRSYMRTVAYNILENKLDAKIINND